MAFAVFVCFVAGVAVTASQPYPALPEVFPFGAKWGRKVLVFCWVLVGFPRVLIGFARFLVGFLIYFVGISGVLAPNEI